MTTTLSPSIPSLAPGSDTGISDTDDLTNATTPTLVGTAVANSTIKLYDSDGTTVLGTATASSTGSYSVSVKDTNALSEGAHNLTVTATASGFSRRARTEPVITGAWNFISRPISQLRFIARRGGGLIGGRGRAWPVAQPRPAVA
jgi:hypothetical protein